VMTNGSRNLWIALEVGAIESTMVSED